MGSQVLISAQDARNSAFDHALHRGSTQSQGGLSAMMNKNGAAHAAAVQDYFQHWDDKRAEDETETIRQSRSDNYASLTRQ